MEANVSASEAVSQNNKQSGKSQQPWSDSQWCDCKCPCKPGIDVEKRVWDEMAEEWVDEIELWQDEPVSFRLDILSSGHCRGIVELEIVDTVPDCLEYVGDATLYVGDQAYDREPGDINWGDGGITLSWNLMEIESLAPGESVAIEYEAITRELGENTNEVYVSAHCSEDYSVIVDYYVDEECQGCDVTIHFYVRDLTGGRLPVANIALNVNGEPLVYLEDIATEFFEDTIVMEAGCGQDIHVELMAINSLGLEQYSAIFGNTYEGELE
jgi:hypothetical protein